MTKNQEALDLHQELLNDDEDAESEDNTARKIGKPSMDLMKRLRRKKAAN